MDMLVDWQCFLRNILNLEEVIALIQHPQIFENGPGNGFSASPKIFAVLVSVLQKSGRKKINIISFLDITHPPAGVGIVLSGPACF